MNRKNLIESIKEYIVNVELSDDSQLIKNIDWKIQEDNKETLLFLKATENLKNLLQDKNLSSLVVTTEDLNLPNQIIVQEESWLKVQKIICDLFFPKLDVKVIGITGTNGKTSTACFISQLLTLNEKSSAYVGTLGIVSGKDQKIIKDFSQTTPSYIDIRKILAGVFGKFDYLVFEVSSHALIQDRFYEISFDAAGWTSFSQDHLDYHKTMDEYFQAKMKIFSKLKNSVEVIFSQSEKELILKTKSNVRESFYAESYTNPIFLASYNRANFDVATGVVKSLIKDANIDEAKILPPPGRYQVVKKDGYEIVIDFAHTPDALTNITRAIKESSVKKIVTIFGCGGDRDPLKRPLMAKAACEYSDVVIITSDNPRFEDPEKIIEDIKKGMHSTPYFDLASRKEAIEFALKNYSDHIILIAGKGHENYLDIKGTKHPYSDLEEVERFLND